MKWMLPIVGCLCGGLLVGFAGGWLSVGRAQVPDHPPSMGPSLVPPAPPLAAVPAPPVAEVENEPPPAPAPAAAAPEPAKPAADAGAAPDPDTPGYDPSEISLVPRGPGHFAILELQAADLTQLEVRQGTLARDGAASWATFAKHPRLTLLKGAEVRVELLHVGFDAEARPVVAHVRTTGHAGGEVEGVVPLRVGDKFVPVRGEAPAAE